MKTIYLTKNDFESFITKKQIAIKKSLFNEAKTKGFSVDLKQDKKITKTPIFISDVKLIKVPNEGLIPQYVSLYGLPYGLFDSSTSIEGIKNNKLKMSSIKDIVYTETERKFVFYRRALLFANAWMLKEYDAQKVKEAIDYIISEKVFDLVDKWVEATIESGKYIETRPHDAHLDDEIYDYQFFGMGTFLRSYFFPDMSKMPLEYSDWLVQKCNKAIVTDAPDKFVGLEPLIAGYLIALKASNMRVADLSFVVNKATKFNFSEQADIFSMIYVSMFFIGLFESKADSYFYASGASSLFETIDLAAWSLANKTSKGIDFSNAFDDFVFAQLNPIENAAKYYSLKNPSIVGKDFVLFSSEIDELDLEKVYTLMPKDVEDFIYKSKKIEFLSEYMSNKLFITRDREKFESLRYSNIKIALLYNGLIKLSDSVFPYKYDLITDSELIKRWVACYFNKNIELVDNLKNSDETNLVLITDNFQISSLAVYQLKSSLNTNVIENITVFNFFENKNEEAKIRKQQDLFDFRDKSKKYQNYVNVRDNSTLQNELEKIFPDKRCHVISKEYRDTPWEMVLLGIGGMRNYDFNNSIIYDLREDNDDKQAYEIVLRCFRDLIVYDKEQRYMFMNL